MKHTKLATGISIFARRCFALGALAMPIGCGGDASDPAADGGSESSGEATTASTDASTTASTTMPASTTADPTGDQTGAQSEDTGEDTHSDESSDDGADSTGAPAIPTIVTLSPANGDSGVHDDAVIVVQFSEPMDPASTQAAYQSPSVPAAAVTFAWNDAGDTMTVTPNEPFEYAAGLDPATTEALRYGFTITTAATSLAGASLADDVDVEFTTLRNLFQLIERDPALSGNVASFQGPLGTQFIGDRSTNESVRYAVTFDLATLAPDIESVDFAEIQAAWSSQSGSPWQDLGGSTYCQHIVYDELAIGVYDEAAIGDDVMLFESEDDPTVARDMLAVVTAVVEDPATYDNRVQLQIRWVTPTDGDDYGDNITLVPDDLELVVAYFAH